MLGLYLPGTQVSQVMLSFQVYPGLQRHWERFADPISESEKFGHCAQSEREVLAGKEEKVSSGQTEQFDAPVIFLNVPGGHAEQF